MLPPVLEIYVLWHLEDDEGAAIAAEFVRHFHGDNYSGLIDGAVEVYIRSDGWQTQGGVPRPITLPGQTDNGVAGAKFVAIVPVLGLGLARAAESDMAWRNYLQILLDAHADPARNVRIIPLKVDSFNGQTGWLGQHFSQPQLLAQPDPHAAAQNMADLRCRDLAQSLAQWLHTPRDQRITVFISHTKRAGEDEAALGALIAQTVAIITDSRLKAFFDSHDLQPGTDWDQDLRQHAAHSALLAIRSDLYASRTWCQREMLIAKTNGMPVVILDALSKREQRGSFLMDHVARMPVRHTNGTWQAEDILAGLNALVDACLQRILWQHQAGMVQALNGIRIDWWAPHAPEPATLSQWLRQQADAGTTAWPGGLCILHPDPPLGADEQAVLQQIAGFAGAAAPFDVTTPRMLAARGM